MLRHSHITEPNKTLLGAKAFTYRIFWFQGPLVIYCITMIHFIQTVKKIELFAIFIFYFEEKTICVLIFSQNLSW